MVTCVPDVRHLLDVGDEVTFSEVKGMTQLNGVTPHPVTATHGKSYLFCMLAESMLCRKNKNPYDSNYAANECSVQRSL